MPKKTAILLWIPLLVFVILCLLLYRGMSLEPKKIPSKLINQPLPILTLQDSNGHAVNTKQLRGQTTLLHVWASWCMTCRAEHAYLMELAREKGIHLVGLVYQDTTANISKWLEDFGDPYELTLFDPDSKATLALGIYGTPETFIIDSEGIIRHKHIGDINDRNRAEILQKVNSLSTAHTSSPRTHNSSPRAHNSSPRAHNSSPRAHNSSPQAHDSSPRAHDSSPRAHDSSPRGLTAGSREQSL